MSDKIVFILEGAHHLQYFPEVLEKFNCTFPLIGDFDDTEIMIEKAKELIREGTKVIISSGGYYNELVRRVNIPIVPITRTWAGIPEAVSRARRLSDKPAIIARNGVFLIASEQYKSKYNDNIRIERFDKNEECIKILQQLKEENYQVLICGSRGARLAQPMGFRIIVVPFEEQDIEHAIREANHVLSYLETIEQTGSILKAIQNSVSSPIIATDSGHRITEINNAALNILHETRANLTGKKLDDTVLAPVAELENYQTNSAVSSLLVTIGKQLMSVSLMPITGDNPMTVITFSPAMHSHAAEEKKKAVIRDKGHLANYHFDQIIGDSPAMLEAIRTAKKYARVDSSILITAPTGCGKEMFAQSIHNSSRRRSMPFVVVNCAALPESLLESTLFGYEKGAFTGAAKEGRQGLFLLADGGTIFLDEISEMPLSLQSRFLRVLQEKEISPLGSDRVIPVDVRILAATNKNLYEMTEKGTFREDLFYRIAILELTIPPLSKRKDDIPTLSRHFLFTHSQALSLPCPEIDDEAMDYIETLPFLGNVRQLENLIERLLVLHEGEQPINAAQVRSAFSRSYQEAEQQMQNIELPEEERLKIIQTLRKTNGSRKEAAEIMGMSTTTLWRRMQKYNIRL